jgi:geranylgeranyl pyrophosphate synthase
MKVDRFQDMNQTIEGVREEFTTFVACGRGLAGSSWATDLLRSKLSGTPVRAYFLAKTAQWLWPLAPRAQRLRRPAQEWQKLLDAQLPFVFETIITIQYLHNQILDGKSGVTSRERISQNLLAANLLKEQLYDYLDSEIPTWARATVTATVRKVFVQVDRGQYLEQTYNTYDAFQKGSSETNPPLPASLPGQQDLAGLAAFTAKLERDLPPMLHGQLAIYFSRIYLTCASLFVEASRLLGTLLAVPSRSLDSVLQFSCCYGIMRQLVNDNADWVPSSYGLATKTKVPADTFSDLRNGTLTLPVIFFLADNKNSLLQQLLNKQMRWLPEFETAIFQEMLASNALYKSIQNTRILTEIALAYLPRQEVATAFLADTCHIAEWNKFLAPCLRNRAYAAYRRTAYHQHTRRLISQLRAQRQEKPATAGGVLAGFFTQSDRRSELAAVARLEAILWQTPALT